MTHDTVDDLEALRRLAARLLPEVAPWGQLHGPTVLHPAGLPPDLRLDLPLPAGSRLIGSCTNGSFSLILFDSDSSPQRVLSAYEGELTTRGWYRHDTDGQSGFLQPGERAFLSALFCRGPQGPSLRVGAVSRSGPDTQLRLELETDPERSPCARPQGLRMHRRRPPMEHPPFPVLAAPPGAAMRGSGYGGGEGAYQSHADIESELNLDQVVSHVTAILEDAGWILRDSGRTGPVAWSDWTCRDEQGAELQGSFLAVEHAPLLYSLQLERDISPDSRTKAEQESRERALTLKRATVERFAAPIEIEEPVTEDEFLALHELILRVVAPAYPGNPDAADAQLLVGTLPDSLLTDLPLPPETRVLGSLVSSRRTAVYLESRATPRQILSFYQAHLSPPSWTFFGAQRHLGGFAPEGTVESIGAQFCPVKEGPAIGIGAHVGRPGVASVWINAYSDLSGTPCENPDAPPAWQYRNRQPQLPILTAPAHSDFAPGGGSGGETHWESRGFLYGALSLPEVAEHYSRQFEVAGWIARDRGADNVLAWSRWTSADEPADALFLARRLHSDGYALIARATGTTSTDA